MGGWLAGILAGGRRCDGGATVARRHHYSFPSSPTHPRRPHAPPQARQASLRAVSFKASDGTTTTLDAKKLKRVHSKVLLDK